MITAITRAMVGDEPEVIEQRHYNGHWAEIILHADQEGKFSGLYISPEFPAEVIERDLWVNLDDKVRGFEGANDAIGTLVLKFSDRESLEMVLANPKKWIKVVVE